MEAERPTPEGAEDWHPPDSARNKVEGGADLVGKSVASKPERVIQSLDNTTKKIDTFAANIRDGLNHIINRDK